MPEWLWGWPFRPPKSRYTRVPARPGRSPRGIRGTLFKAGCTYDSNFALFGQISTGSTNTRRRPNEQMQRNRRTYRATKTGAKRPIPTPHANQQYGEPKPLHKQNGKNLRQKTNTNTKRQPTIWANETTAKAERQKPKTTRKIRKCPVGRESTGETGEKERIGRARRLRNPSAGGTWIQEGRPPTPRVALYH